MSLQDTWCDALFVQAVADCQNVAVHQGFHYVFVQEASGVFQSGILKFLL